MKPATSKGPYRMSRSLENRKIDRLGKSKPRKIGRKKNLKRKGYEIVAIKRKT